VFINAKHEGIDIPEGFLEIYLLTYVPKEQTAQGAGACPAFLGGTMKTARFQALEQKGFGPFGPACPGANTRKAFGEHFSTGRALEAPGTYPEVNRFLVAPGVQLSFPFARTIVDAACQLSTIRTPRFLTRPTCVDVDAVGLMDGTVNNPRL